MVTLPGTPLQDYVIGLTARVVRPCRHRRQNSTGLDPSTQGSRRLAANSADKSTGSDIFAPTHTSGRNKQGPWYLVYPVWSGVADLVFDENYLRALRDRDRDAEDLLISHFSRPVQLKLRARLRSPELIEDAYQETFLRVLKYFRSGKTLENPASLPGFVHSVCHNISLEFLRAHTRQNQIDPDFTEPADSRLNPESTMVNEERKKLVVQVLDELAEKDRRLLRRLFLDEEDKDVVCREFDVDRSYLRVLVHRARTRFRTVASRPRFTRTASGG